MHGPLDGEVFPVDVSVERYAKIITSGGSSFVVGLVEELEDLQEL